MEQIITGRLELNLLQPNILEPTPSPRTPSEWFAIKFPDTAGMYGCPFLELRQTTCDGFSKIMIRETYGVCLRRDLPDETNKQQEAWKGVHLIEATVEPA
jgi:hypothetical protein